MSVIFVTIILGKNDTRGNLKVYFSVKLAGF